MKLKIPVLFVFLSAAAAFAGHSEEKWIDADSPKLAEESFDKTYKDFIFRAKIKTENGGKARVNFHRAQNGRTGYSVEIDNDAKSANWWRSTGSLTSVRNIVKKFARDGEWFDLEIKVHGAEINVNINGLCVVEYVEPLKPFRTKKNSGMLLSEGKLSMEHTGGGRVYVKGASVEPLPARADIDNQRLAAIDESSDAVIRLHQADFPVMDFHVHLKGGLTSDWAFAKSRKIGINYGVAPNCGRDFELNESSKAEDFIKHTGSQYPFILCMQAEGREWHKLFGPDIRGRFSYVFTDAMTFNDINGKRTHIWRDDEVDCPKGSEEAYMDLIVKTICEILENEPADIYTNPMRLPKALEPGAKKYWTDKRREKVLDSLAKSGKALEINMLSRLPDFEFIKAAKSRGVKFTFGSNNAAPEFGRFEYGYEAAVKCGLTSADIFNPYSAKISK